MSSHDVAIRPEGECSATPGCPITISIPASLLEPGRQYTFTISAKPPEPLPSNSPTSESDEASA